MMGVFESLVERVEMLELKIQQQEAEIQRMMSQPLNDEIFDTKQAAKFLGIGEGRMRRLSCDGAFPHYQSQNGRGNRYKKSDLIKYQTAIKTESRDEIKRMAIKRTLF